MIDRIAGKPFPGQLNRLMRDGEFRTRDFIDAQLKFYRLRACLDSTGVRITEELQAFTGLRNNSIATTGLQRRGLKKLAALSDWAYMA